MDGKDEGEGERARGNGGGIGARAKERSGTERDTSSIAPPPHYLHVAIASLNFDAFSIALPPLPWYLDRDYDRPLTVALSWTFGSLAMGSRGSSVFRMVDCTIADCAVFLLLVYTPHVTKGYSR